MGKGCDPMIVEGKGEGELGFLLIRHDTLHVQAKPNVVT